MAEIQALKKTDFDHQPRERFKNIEATGFRNSGTILRQPFNSISLSKQQDFQTSMSIS